MRVLWGIFFAFGILAAEPLALGRLQYDGGDWYSNPSSLPNLILFFNQKTKSRLANRERTVSLKNATYTEVPVLYFTGHEGFSLSAEEKQNLRWFLENGGFLFADDNYGNDKNIRLVLNSLIPGVQLEPVPLQHSIFLRPFAMPKGVPKIHEHDGGAPQVLGLFLRGKMVAFYAYNTDLGDGWENRDVHRHSEEQQLLALKMGANVLWYALTRQE